MEGASGGGSGGGARDTSVTVSHRDRYTLYPVLHIPEREGAKESARAQRVLLRRLFSVFVLHRGLFVFFGGGVCSF